MAINTAKRLYDEISNDFKTSNRTRRLDLPEFMTLTLFSDKTKVEFSIGWYDTFNITFNPKTIKVKYIKVDKQTKETKTITKQLPLDQENLLDTILSLYIA